MLRLILSAGLIGLLAACSSTWDTSTSSSDYASDTSAMGGPGGVWRTGGPIGSSGGGPN